MSVSVQAQPQAGPVPAGFLEIFRNLFRARAIYFRKEVGSSCSNTNGSNRPTEWDDPT